MPADDAYDVVHHLTIGGDKYGCHSRKPYAKHYWAPQRIFHSDGSFEVISVRVPHTNSRDCRSFALWDVDPMCIGCTTTRDTDYRDRMLRMREQK